MIYIKEYSQFNNTNESMKTWLTSFLIMSNLGLVPISVKSQDSETKKEFIESQPQEKVDAALFFDYLSKFGSGRDMDLVWEEFTKSNRTKSSLDEVRPYIGENGKNYYFDKGYEEYDFSSVDQNQFKPVNWLTDMGGFVPDNMEPQINNWISNWEKSTSIEIGIITIKSLGDNTIEQYAEEQFNRLGIGKKGADNGILIVFAMDERKSRIETGYGIEPFLPDLICRRILDNQVKPNFKSGDYFGGIMSALNEIKNYMGEDPYEEKVRWLEEKKKKEEQESREFWSNVGDFMIVSLMLGLVLGSIGYFMWRKNRTKKVKGEILEMITDLEKIIKDSPKSTIINSGRLSRELSELRSILDDVDTKAKDISTKNIKSLSELELSKTQINNLKRTAETRIREYLDLSRIIQGKLYDIGRLDKLMSGAISAIDKSILSYNKIKEYGYDSNQPPSKEDVNSLLPLSLLAASLLSSNIDDAINKSDEFKSKLSRIVGKASEIDTKLSSIQKSKSNVESSNLKIGSEMQDLLRLKSWANRGELEEINGKIDKFNSTKASSKDWLNLDKSLTSLLSDIKEMRSKWASRKRRKEEEEEARRRRSSSSSYGGGGYGGGGSSFGGFGGGSSGGGGASSGW